MLAAFAKYPIASNLQSRDACIGRNKFSFFQTEEEYFSDVARNVGLVKRTEGVPYWSRHPLAFLVEAADDICYAIIDIEDGFELGCLDFNDAREVLSPIASDPRPSSGMADTENVGKLRALAINNLIKECVRVFVENEPDLLTGSFQCSLIDLTKYKQHIDMAKQLGRQKIYNDERTIKLEIAGSEVVSGLLDIFWDVVLQLQEKGFDPRGLKNRPRKLSQLMGRSLRPVARTYDALFCVVDFISGMTDRYALELYRTLTGISV